MNKKIIVIVPAYNEELLIEKTLDSIPSRADSIVVINDNSQDKTKSIVKKYKEKN